MISLQDHFKDYITECQYIRRLRPETIRGSQEAFRHFMKTMPELQTAMDVTSEMVTIFFARIQTRERFVGSQKVTGIRDSTIASYANRLKSFFKWLRVKKIIAENPFDNLRFPEPTYTDRRALSGSEIKRIMGAATQYAQSAFLLKRDTAMIGVLTFCGLRKNELISLEVKDIDIHGNFLTVRGETSKSKKTRRIPINPQLRLYLNEYLIERRLAKATSEFLWVSSVAKERLTSHGLKHWVARLIEQSGVKFHLHRFRHTFATNLAMQNVGAVKIQKLMGHHDIQMTQTYLRSIQTEDMRDDINKLSFENLA